MATVKQKIATKEVLKGTPIKKAMQKAGYATSTSITTGKLTRSKGFQEIIESAISDKALAKVHKEGLKATTFFTEGLGRGETVLVEKPDFSVRHKYLESGYKIKGRFPKEQDSGNKTLIINISGENAERYGFLPHAGTEDNSER